MSQSLAIRIAAAAGFLAVALGAFGAHGLKGLLEQNGTAATWQTAVFYHALHSVVLLVLAQRQPVPRLPWLAMAIGILIFSGTLYALAITNIRWLGAITPIGGVAFLIGWCALFCCPLAGFRRDKQ